LEEEDNSCILIFHGSSIEPGNKELHPWSQSESEAKYYIGKLARPGDAVLDPMLGSGTTVISALSLGRRATGIEIKTSTFKSAYARVAKFAASEGNHEGTPRQLIHCE
jgi:DNA modification methylase